MDGSHRHAWSVVDFGIADGRPIMRQACSCGATRTVPAWDRAWTPRPQWRLVADGPLRGRLMVSDTTPESPRHDAPLQVDVWADIACPWCYIGFANLEVAIGALAAEADAPAMLVDYHSFELDPDAPIDFSGTAADDLAQRKGIDLVAARELNDRVTAVAAQAGLIYDFDALRRTRTAKGHQLIHYARQRGRQKAAVERLYRAHFSEGRHLGRDEELAELAADIGLDGEDVLRSLRADEHLEAVRADEQQAAAIGIRGVPFTVIDGRYGLSGAQPPEVVREALRLALRGRAGSLEANVT